MKLNTACTVHEFKDKTYNWVNTKLIEVCPIPRYKQVTYWHTSMKIYISIEQ